MNRGLSILRGGDEAAFFAFCERVIDSSLILVCNAERAGFEDRGERLQGTYAACWEGGEITAVAAHYWNGNVVVQGDVGVEQAAAHAVASSGRTVQGLLGPVPLVKRVKESLDLAKREVAHGADETLFGLDLDRLVLPASPGATRLECRHPKEGELALLAAWRAAYCVETLGSTLGPELEQQCRQQVESLHRSRECWVALHDGQPSAFSGFNATARGIVQVGGVYTPPELRSRGYARAAVASSLLEARTNGAKRSVLFADEDNLSAIRAYKSLGYQAIGRFGLIVFR